MGERALLHVGMVDQGERYGEAALGLVKRPKERELEYIVFDKSEATRMNHRLDRRNCFMELTRVDRGQRG